LSEEVVAALQLPEMRESFAKLGAQPSGNSPAEFVAEIKSEIARWGKLIREAGIKGD
jgi:tripartite-type tricarboxylate transporter receptor subunit TctC